MSKESGRAGAMKLKLKHKNALLAAIIGIIAIGVYLCTLRIVVSG